MKTPWLALSLLAAATPIARAADLDCAAIISQGAGDALDSTAKSDYCLCKDVHGRQQVSAGDCAEAAAKIENSDPKLSCYYDKKEYERRRTQYGTLAWGPGDGRQTPPQGWANDLSPSWYVDQHDRSDAEYVTRLTHQNTELTVLKTAAEAYKSGCDLAKTQEADKFFYHRDSDFVNKWEPERMNELAPEKAKVDQALATLGGLIDRLR